MKKILKITTIIMIILSMGVLSSYAADYSCDIVFTQSKETVKPGETIEITVSADSINAGDGITGISAVLDYSTDVFEEMELLKTTDWDAPVLIGTTVSTNVSSLEGKTTKQDMFKIKLKVKSGVANGKYDVSLKNIDIGTDDYTSIKKDVATAKVEVKADNENDKDQDEDKDKDKDKDEEQDKDKDKEQDKDKDKEQDKDNGKKDETKNETKEIATGKNTGKDSGKTDTSVSNKEIAKAGVAFGVTGIVLGVGIIAVIYKKI